MGDLKEIADDFIPIYQGIEATVWKHAQLIRNKARVEEDLETSRHEQELLELWQTTVDAEEEADYLETKLQLAHRIIEIHEKMMAMDEILMKTKDSLVQALQDMEPLFFHTRNQFTSISLLKTEDSTEPQCSYAQLSDTITQLRDMMQYISSQPLVNIETAQFVSSFIHSIKESTCIVEKNISEITSLQRQLDERNAAASQRQEEILQKDVEAKIEAKIEAVKIEAALFDVSEI